MYYTIKNNTINQFKQFLIDNYGQESTNTIYIKYQLSFSLEQLLQTNQKDNWESLAQQWLNDSIQSYKLYGEKGMTKLAGA